MIATCQRDVLVLPRSVFLILSATILLLVPCAANADDIADPTCYGAAYAQTKSAFDAKSILTAAGENRIAADSDIDGEQVAKIKVQKHPLGLPPEIDRIERGVKTHWVGGFVNDGRQSWRGIDLDRMEMVTVDRRIYDPPAMLTRPLPDPIIPEDAYYISGRKWSQGQHIEIEIVTHWKLRADQAEAFICVANSAWGALQTQGLSGIPQMTDTASNEIVLLDRVQEGNASYLYLKNSAQSGPLSVIVNDAIRFPAIRW